MTIRNVRLIAIVTLLVGLVSGSIIGCAAPPQETVEEETKTIEIIKEVPMDLTATADAIQTGEIDVGKEFGLGLDERYHEIHTGVLGLECNTCHMEKEDTANEVSSVWNVSPQAPGPVDRTGCLGCHNAGPGNDLYGSDGT